MEATQTIYYTQPSEETTILTPEDQPVFAQPVFAQPVFEQPAKKKKSPLVWLIPVIAVVVAAAVAAVLLLGPLKGWWVKSFGSEEEYREYVQENSAGSPAGTISEVYGSVLTALSGETTAVSAVDVTMKVNVGDKVVALLEDLTEEELGKKLDMDWTKNIELKLSGNAKDDLQQIGATLKISDKEIAVLDAILNMDKGKLFLAVTSLSSEYLEVDFSEYLPTAESAPAWVEMLQDPALVKALPTEEELDAVLDKYIAIVMDNLDDVEKSAEIVKAGQLEQKLTVLTTKISGEDVADAMEDVLMAARDDKQLESIIRKAVAYLETQPELKDAVDADEIYGEFRSAIDKALADLPDMDTEGEPILLEQYINSAHEAVGCVLTVDGKEIARYVEIRDGSKLACELKIADTVEVVGEGIEKNGAVTAQYDVIAEDQKLITISLVDFKAEENAINGKIRIAPSADLLEQIGLTSTASSAIDLAKLQLELGFATAKNTGSVEINVLSGEDLLVGLSFTGTGKAATAITEPKDTCDVENIQDWLEGIDTEKLIDALDEAGLPIKELVFGSAAVSNQATTIY